MHAQGQFFATLLDSSAGALASRAISALSETQDDLVQRWGFRALVSDARGRLDLLAEALAAGRPEIFAKEVLWLATSYGARDVPVDLLRETLRALRGELGESLPPEGAAMATSFLDQALDGLERAPEPPASRLAEGPRSEVTRRVLLHLLQGERAKALATLEAELDAGAQVVDLHEQVLMPIQVEVGRLWQMGEVGIAEEHLASRIVEDALMLLRTYLPKNEEPATHSVLVAGVRGNFHEIGARMVADRFEATGWRALLLGADTPAEALVEGVSHFAPDVVALSAGLGWHVRATAELVNAMHEAHPKVPVLVGGRVYAEIPDLWRDVGAHGSAVDAGGAVSEAQRLLEERAS